MQDLYHRMKIGVQKNSVQLPISSLSFSTSYISIGVHFFNLGHSNQYWTKRGRTAKISW